MSHGNNHETTPDDGHYKNTVSNGVNVEWTHQVCHMARNMSFGYVESTLNYFCVYNSVVKVSKVYQV